LWLSDRHLARTQRIGRYATFEQLVAAEGPAAVAPDLPREELLPALREIYPPQREVLGTVALEIEMLGEAAG